MVGSDAMAGFAWRFAAKRSAFALFAMLVVWLAGTATAHADSFQEMRQRGELTWGGDLQGGAPYVFEDAKSPIGIAGFEVDIARAIALRLGVKARFVQNDWSNLIPALERGDFDVLLNGLEDTPARRERLLLTVPYFVYGETLAVQRGAPYRTLDDLGGKRVATLNQTVAQEILQRHPVEIVLYEGQQEPYFDLAHGRVDAVLLDNVIADIYGCPLAQVQCLPGDVARGVYVAAVRRDRPELRDALNGVLRTMLADGELRRILTSYNLWGYREEELGRRMTEASNGKTGHVESASEVPRPNGSVSTNGTGPQTNDASTFTNGDLREVGVGPDAEHRHFDLAQLLLFLHGALFTLVISLGAFALALPLGLLLAVARGFGSRAVSFAAAAYVEIFRGTPVLLQLYVLYFGLAPLVRLGPFEAAILGLGMNYAAYEAEVHRGALLALPAGQTEAARALGLSPWQALRHVLLPQSFKNALPALTNDFVSLLKDSSLVSVITVVELTKRMTIAAVDLRDWVIPGLVCAGLYFALSFPLSRLALRLERSLTHDSHPRLA
jgi:polar amino acid transport system substrate-binding protein